MKEKITSRDLKVRLIDLFDNCVTGKVPDTKTVVAGVSCINCFLKVIKTDIQTAQHNETFNKKVLFNAE